MEPTFGLVAVRSYQAFESTPEQITLIDRNDIALKMFDIAHAEADRYFEISILILAGLWTIAIVDSTHRLTTRDVPEIIIFSLAVILLVCWLDFFFFSMNTKEY